MTPELRHSCRRAMHVLLPDGRVLRAGRGSLFVLEQLGLGRLWLRLLALPPLIWLVELGYLIVARNRSFFGRFLFRGEPDPSGSDPRPR